MNLFSAFLRDWKTTGSIMPSSRFLQRGMLAPLAFERIRVAVELGPGTGCITAALLGRLASDARLLAVDINETFVQRLGQQFPDPRLEPVHGSATDLPSLLRERNLEKTDCVVSGLPFANLSMDMRDQIVRAASESLAPGGLFVAFQYAPFALPPVLRKHFPGYRTDFVLLNVPPALVYICQRR